MYDMDTTFKWLKKGGLIAVERNCPKCGVAKWLGFSATIEVTVLSGNVGEG